MTRGTATGGRWVRDEGHGDRREGGGVTTAGWRAGLAALQRGDAGVFSRQAAIGLGVPPATIDGRVRSGRYRVLLPGVYAEAGAPDGWLVRVTAALRWAGGRGPGPRVGGAPAWSAGARDQHHRDPPAGR